MGAERRLDDRRYGRLKTASRKADLVAVDGHTYVSTSYTEVGRRTTSAMAAGLTNGVSTLADIVSLLDYVAPRVRQSSPRETEACESPPCGGFAVPGQTSTIN